MLDSLHVMSTVKIPTLYLVIFAVSAYERPPLDLEAFWGDRL